MRAMLVEERRRVHNVTKGRCRMGLSAVLSWDIKRVACLWLSLPMLDWTELDLA